MTPASPLLLIKQTLIVYPSSKGPGLSHWPVWWRGSSPDFYQRRANLRRPALLSKTFCDDKSCASLTYLHLFIFISYEITFYTLSNIYSFSKICMNDEKRRPEFGLVVCWPRAKQGPRSHTPRLPDIQRAESQTPLTCVKPWFCTSLWNNHMVVQFSWGNGNWVRI